jgi:hypothetical protein
MVPVRERWRSTPRECAKTIHPAPQCGFEKETAMMAERYLRLVLTVVALALLVIAGRLLVTPDRSEASRPFEYRYVLYTQSYIRDEQILNQLGQEGWEVVTATHQGFLLKR